MFTINKDIILRNLEEQVQYLTEFHKVNQGFVQWGIRVVGQVDTAEELPNPATYEGEYGDAYAVGYEAPFFFYIWTRASIFGESDYWFPFGEISIVGPQGPKGDKGDKGDNGESSKWFADMFVPISGMKKDDLYLNTDGEVYQYSGTGWRYITNIRGPRGMSGAQGMRGEVGPIGPAGPKGDKGDVGGFINIAGQLTNVEQLPTPSSLGNLTVAYLVNDDLYIQIGQTSAEATWNNMGPLNVATLVTVNGQYQNVWDADTKLDKYTNVTEYNQVYVKAADGSEGTINVTKQSLGDAVVQRQSDGNIYVPEIPAEGVDAASKTYVDQETNKCVKKVEPEYLIKLYGVNSTEAGGAETAFNASQEALDDTVAIRIPGGQLYVGDPYNAGHAATKNYVDTEINNNKYYVHSMQGTMTFSDNTTAYFFLAVPMKTNNAYNNFSLLLNYVKSNYGLGSNGVPKPIFSGTIENKMMMVASMSASSSTSLTFYGLPTPGNGVYQVIVTDMTFTGYSIREFK